MRLRLSLAKKDRPIKSRKPHSLVLSAAIPAASRWPSGYPRFILLSASRADDLMTPEHCALNLHKDRDVHAAQFQHHVIPRYWATECKGCTIFHPIGMYAPARTCCTSIPSEFPILCMVWISPEHGPALNQRTKDVSPMLCLQNLTFPPVAWNVEMPIDVWSARKVPARQFCIELS